MSSRPSWSAHLGRSLQDHLERLCVTLDTLSERVREAVAQAVGQSVAGAVQEALRAVLGATARGEETRWLSPWSRASAAREWGDPDDWAEEDDPDSPWAERRPYPSSSARSPTLATPSPDATHWHHALAVGCEAAAWWLRCRFGRLYAWLALAVGCTATAAARLAGARCAASLLSLLTLAETAHAGATVLSNPAAS
jgi:hypothetical protein